HYTGRDGTGRWQVQSRAPHASPLGLTSLALVGVNRFQNRPLTADVGVDTRPILVRAIDVIARFFFLTRYPATHAPLQTAVSLSLSLSLSLSHCLHRDNHRQRVVYCVPWHYSMLWIDWIPFLHID